MRQSSVTYRDLLEALQKLDQDDLDNSVSVRDGNGEIIGVQSLSFDDGDGALDVDHMILELNSEVS